jgi:hypothetical protein
LTWRSLLLFATLSSIYHFFRVQTEAPNHIRTLSLKEIIKGRTELPQYGLIPGEQGGPKPFRASPPSQLPTLQSMFESISRSTELFLTSSILLVADAPEEKRIPSRRTANDRLAFCSAASVLNFLSFLSQTNPRHPRTNRSCKRSGYM